MKAPGRPAPQAPAGRPKAINVINQSRISFYGRHEPSATFIFVSEVVAPVEEQEATNVKILFERGEKGASASLLVYGSKVGGQFGVIVVVRVPDPHLGNVISLVVEAPGIGELLLAVDHNSSRLSPAEIVSETVSLLEGADSEVQVLRLKRDLLQMSVGEAYVEIYGYHGLSAGWLLNGWVSNDWIAAASKVEVRIEFLGASAAGAATVAYYNRDDLVGRGLGFVMHVPSRTNEAGRLSSLHLLSNEAVVTARPALTLEKLAGELLAEAFSGLVARCNPGPSHQVLVGLLLKQRSTTERSEEADLRVEIDAAYDCRPDGILLVGWKIAGSEADAEVRLCSQQGATVVDFAGMSIPISRPDVIETFGAPLGIHEIGCGFIVRVPVQTEMVPPYELEVRTPSGDSAKKSIPVLRPPDLANIRQVFSTFETPVGSVEQIYSRVIGPSIRACNQRICSQKDIFDVVQFGRTNDPELTVIIPLYGRTDFMRYQISLFARHGLGLSAKIVYVLDDPPMARETKQLANALYAKFQIPITLMLSKANVGFARANKIGLTAAEGSYVCFMNSDVFPSSADWLPQLANSLESDETLGAVGPILLFEDGSIQHQGVTFESISSCDGWYFPKHDRKGLRPLSKGGLYRASAITGACVVMRLQQALTLRGFDDEYIIGDFEDTDLCLKLHSLGLQVAVDFDVRLYHLERKSQVSSAHTWRTNMTLYNAWIHQHRWRDVIERLREAPSTERIGR